MDYTYDLLHQLKTVTEDDGRATAYSYDGMGRVVKMEYPHGWVEDYVYDSIGQLLRVDDTDPTQKDLKQQKHVYKYDDCGNMIYEYMRGNGTGEATTENTYAYDALHRITRADEVYGKAWREYQYDSLGNLTYESNSNNVHYDYKLNDLNQITQKTYSSNDKEGTLYTYDNRGNLVLEQYGKLNGNGNNNGNGQRSTVGQYTYDETNKMVLGVNSSGESSAYLYNGLGALVEDTWKIAKNGYGYHDVDAGLGDADPNNGRGGGGSNGQGNGNGNGQGNGNGSGDKPTGSLVTNFSTVVKEFVVDYTSPTFEPLMEHEVNGLDYRYVYGNDRLSVNITGVETSSGNLIENGNQIRLYYHMDYLGTADYLTSPVTGKVESWTHYNEWGEITHNAVLKTGKRELDLVKRYATHDYDAVLGMYYAKARFYDAENRRFAAVDPLKGEITNPLTMVQYLYVVDNPLRWVDLLGLYMVDPDPQPQQPLTEQNYELSLAFNSLLHTLKSQYSLLKFDITGRFNRTMTAVLNNKGTILRMAEKYDIPAEMIAAVIVKEQITQSAPDEVLLIGTYVRGSGHSFGLGAITPNTAYKAWKYLANRSVTPTAKEDYQKQISDAFAQARRSSTNVIDQNIVLGSKLVNDTAFGIESIAVVLQYNYGLFKKNYNEYEKGYFELFKCTEKNVDRSTNEWLVDNIYEGFTEEIYGHVLSYYNSGHDYILSYTEDGNVKYSTTVGKRYADLTRQYLPALRKILELSQ